MHILGARARGNHRLDSALELALGFAETADETKLLGSNASSWTQELAALSGLQIVDQELRSNKDAVKLPVVTVCRRQAS